MRKLVTLLIALLALAPLALADGAADYGKFCASCHGATGQGTPGVFPPLADWAGHFAQNDEGRAYLVHVIVFGLQGQISAQGKTYNGFMPPFAQLSNDQVAGILNYLLTEWNKDLLPKDFRPLTADEVAKLRAKALTPADVFKARQALVESLGIK
ncbi:c-type cytochrome [Oceanithermus profundus]|uniref:Cytochrome c class I n=1 Tax=Oceanithermus profundus (strain DSM 14977 / NBRC 100410 / VKM B-2274 / 506) TaxID=670487 RepID=E4U7J5_OCEP5|nr:cytochrome c [Oceanithermus profundus]ADR36444.1 cytochrome c class I [Oceanithermus profundus DSM 14977]